MNRLKMVFSRFTAKLGQVIHSETWSSYPQRNLVKLSTAITWPFYFINIVSIIEIIFMIVLGGNVI